MNKISKLKELAAKATPGPWKWFTSNSYNRLSSIPGGKDGDIVSAFKATDGWPCLSVSQQNMAFIEEFNPATVLMLLSKLEEAEQQTEELGEGMLKWMNRAKEAEEELDRRDKEAGESFAYHYRYAGGEIAE